MSLSKSLIGIQTLNNSWDYQYSPVHADNNITTKDLIAPSAQAGAQVVRIPVDLSTVEANGFPRWMLDSFRSILDFAASQNVQVIFQPGQTPIDLSNDGTVSGQPGTTDDLIELAGRFGKGVEQIYRDMPELTHMINGWEVGNEPNLSYDYTGSGYEDYNVEDARFWTVRTENAEKYAEYLAATSIAIKSISNDIPVYAAGVAHNDVRYLETLFSSLEKLDVDLDGFSIHPYTTYAIDEHGNIQGPESGRPTDWIGGTSTTAEAWDYYYSFQGALETAQSLMEQHGYADAQLWVTEFGVPSHLGNRNAGEDGLIDQARWFAEAFGVFDSMELPTLSGVIAHHALDNQSYEENLSYDAYDEGFRNDGSWFEAEDAFGLFHEVDGIIEEKPAARLMDAIAGNDEYRFENIHSVHTGASHDYSAAASSSGLTEGIITLVHDGDDHVTGSQFSDSVFAGNGDDTVFGGAGEERIFGGYGNDILRGDAGNDDLYGNAGNDIIYAGENDRVDGGSGTDRVIVDGFAADYSVFDDGEQIQIVGNDVNIIGRNVEVLQFGDGSMVELSKPGPLPNPGTTPEPEPQPDPEPTPAP